MGPVAAVPARQPVVLGAVEVLHESQPVVHREQVDARGGQVVLPLVHVRSMGIVRRVVMVVRRRVVRARSTAIVRLVVRVARVNVAHARASRRMVTGLVPVGRA